MQPLISSLLLILVSAVPALADNGSEAAGSSLLLILFLGFAALIVVFQFIPGMVLCYSMLKGIFTNAPKEAAADAIKR